MSTRGTVSCGTLILTVLWGCAQAPQAERMPTAGPAAHGTRPGASPALTFCSFNIKFLGHYKDRKNDVLVNVLRDYDVVAIQELVAPPYPMQYPDGTAAKQDAQAAAFFDRMRAVGFDYVLSEEDTGRSMSNHSNGTGTEWFAVFYKPGQLASADDLPGDFLDADRSANPVYDRVPCAFGFRTTGGTLDFVLIDVHLAQGAGTAARTRRRGELAAIGRWVDEHDEAEKDFVILGDMNIEDSAELTQTTPTGFVSLNTGCLATNCAAVTGGGKPFDHVMYRASWTTEMDPTFGFQVVNLIEAVRPTWSAADGPFPGDPYNATTFPLTYSDHHPVTFRMIVPEVDDDPNP